MRTSNRSTAVNALARSLALALAGVVLTDGSGAAAATPMRIRDLPAAPRQTHAGPTPAGSNLVVTNCADSGPGSLRQAMLDARNNTIIDFRQLQCSTITLTTGALTDPDTDSLQLVATPAIVSGRPQPTVTINGGDASRIIEHRSGGHLELTGIALANGRSTAGKGGCLYSIGHITLTAVTVSNCSSVATGSSAALGGGIWSDDQVDLLYSTVSGNVALANTGGYSYGGGVFSSYGVYSLFSTVQGNRATGFGYGGGVSVVGYASLRSSTINANTAAYGGGLALFSGGTGPGDFRIRNSTIASNHATGFAAGIEVIGSLTIHNSTIALNVSDHANTATIAAGVMMEGTHQLTLVSSIVARNTQGGVAHDVGGFGTIDGSANLVMSSSLTLPAGTLTSDPMLNVFGNYGGQTNLLGLKPGSPAINAGSNPLNTLCDQRGGTLTPSFGMTGIYQRVAGNAPDIGAFEYAAGDLLFADGFEEVALYSCYPT
ncbi:MAG: choice-of-anchor Q domain-containing protein [Dokdonella sp.]|uniref:choice-of-anchor Q domain-containing protein n=1 Tax=Dokdonella sp. TaxID=2291710 RepID=UPI003266193D